jgi:hypothetical protein
MTDDTTPTPPTSPQSSFSWKKPEKYWPKRDYYADLVMSYSAMTDIINPDAIECDYSDVRILDSMMVEQTGALHTLAKSIFDQVYRENGELDEQKLLLALRMNKAFRECFATTNLTLVRRYIASNSAL